MRHAVLLGACVLLTASGAQAQRCGVTLPPTAGFPPTATSPVIVRLLGDRITPVPMTDNLYHLAFAAQVTNLAPATATIIAMTPVDPMQKFGLM